MTHSSNKLGKIHIAPLPLGIFPSISYYNYFSSISIFLKPLGIVPNPVILPPIETLPTDIQI